MTDQFSQQAVFHADIFEGISNNPSFSMNPTAKWSPRFSGVSEQLAISNIHNDCPWFFREDFPLPPTAFMRWKPLAQPERNSAYPGEVKRLMMARRVCTSATWHAKRREKRRTPKSLRQYIAVLARLRRARFADPVLAYLPRAFTEHLESARIDHPRDRPFAQDARHFHRQRREATWACVPVREGAIRAASCT